MGVGEAMGACSAGRRRSPTIPGLRGRLDFARTPSSYAGMCNHYRADPDWVARTGEFSHLKIPLRFPATPGNYRPPRHIYPGRDGVVLRLAEDGAALEPAVMRWGLIPFFHRKSVKEWKVQCNNCRSEEMATKATFKGALARR